MAITTSPLLSLDASGSIGKAIVYSKWKGINYARQHVTPSNPKTTAQQNVRGTFKWVHDAYKFLDALATEAWIAYAKGKPLTPANAFQQANIPALMGKTNLADIVFSKPVGGAPPTPSLSAAGGTNQVTLTPGIPAPPVGWTIVGAIGIAMEDVSPAVEMEQKISFAVQNLVSPYHVVITGLKAATQYECGLWYKYLKADGTNAYGGSINVTATTS